MAPFSQSTKLQRLSEDKQGSVFNGTVDGDWVMLTVPNGGYVLGLIIEACIMHQSQTSHKDPIHVTAHFLRATNVGPFEVHVRTIKKGRSFTNIVAELIQKNQVRVSAHLIYGSLQPSSAPFIHIPRGSPYSRRHPFTISPAECQPQPVGPRMKFGNYVSYAKDEGIFARNQLPHFNREQGFQSGSWFELSNTKDTVTPASLALFADLSTAVLFLMPEELRTNPSAMWFPTMCMTLQFLAPLPPDAAQRTVGVYSRAGFVGDPQGQSAYTVEVWSSPSALGEPRDDNENWVEEQVCLAVSTQIALIVPGELNFKLGGVKL